MSARPSFTLGIEEEYQTIDPVTRDLRSHIQAQIIAQGRMRLQERVKPEMHGSVVEVGTGICRTIAEARGEVFELCRQMVKLAEDNNLRLAAAGTHPFADRISSTHIDVVGTKFDIWIDDTKIMAGGRFLLRGDS